MGGSFYDRDIVTTNSSTGASQESQAALSQSQIHSSCNVNGKTLVSSSKHPIIICFDVTGSMGNWPRVIYDKLPMFYGQIMSNAYLSDPSIAFMAVGDGRYGQHIQCSNFAQGTDIDSELKKMFIAGHGQGSPENYEFAAYMLAKQSDFKSSGKPFFFLIGDAKYFNVMSASTTNAVFGTSEDSNIASRSLWAEVMDKTNMFYFHKAYRQKGGRDDISSLNQWTTAIGADRILQLDNAKAVVDAMLGVVSISSGERTIESYVEDMEARGQDDDRIKQVTACLHQCSAAMAIACSEMNGDNDEKQSDKQHSD